MPNTQPKPHKICLEGRPDEWPMDRLVLALVEIVRPWGFILVPLADQCCLLVEDRDCQPAALGKNLIRRIEALEDVYLTQNKQVSLSSRTCFGIQMLNQVQHDEGL